MAAPRNAADTTTGMASQPIANSHDRAQLVLMFVLIAAFLIAVPMMFVHPSVVLGLFWAGLITITGAGLIGRIIRGRKTTPESSDACACPSCGAVHAWRGSESGKRHCPDCGFLFAEPSA